MTTATAPGGLLGVYRVSLKGRLSRSGPQLLLAAILGGLAVLLVSVGLSQPQSNTLEPGLATILVTFGLLAWAYFVGWSGVHGVEVYADGLAWEDAAGRHRISWNDVAAVRRKPRLSVNGFPTEGDVTLTLSDGRTVTFDFMLDDYDELADLVERIRVVQLLPSLLAELERRPLTFGTVSLRNDGIVYKGFHRPWASFEYAIDSGNLVLVPAGGRFGWNDRTEIPVADMPDWLTLVELMAQVGKPPVNPAQTLPASAWGDII